MDAAEAAIGHHDDQIAVDRLAGHGSNDRIDVRQMPRAHVIGREVVDEFRFGEPFFGRQARPEYGGDDDLISA